MKIETALYFRSFLVLLAAVSLIFIWLLLPFYGAVFWGVVLAIIFAPLQRRILTAMNGRKTLAALASLVFIILIVIIPVILIAGALVQEMVALYKLMEGGELNLGNYLDQILRSMPESVRNLADRLLGGDLNKVREQFSDFAVSAGQFLTKQALSIGSNTFQFLVGLGIMLYLLFFLLRDGTMLGRHCRNLIPLSEEQKSHLLRKLTIVVRATIKGNLAVAATQGALGGLIFFILGIQASLFWGVLMAVLSLLPAVGASLIWGPVAIYFFATGQVFEGTVLSAFGLFVIGLVDNVLRPLLVGKDTKIPDYIILISTLGGLSLFGLNGFVIGPLIAALFMACWDLFPAALEQRNRSLEEERNQRH